MLCCSVLQGSLRWNCRRTRKGRSLWWATPSPQGTTPCPAPPQGETPTSTGAPGSGSSDPRPSRTSGGRHPTPVGVRTRPRRALFYIPDINTRDRLTTRIGNQLRLCIYNVHLWLNWFGICCKNVTLNIHIKYSIKTSHILCVLVVYVFPCFVCFFVLVIFVCGWAILSWWNKTCLCLVGL